MRTDTVSGKGMKKKAILFDLDGTLLPMDLEKFTGLYFGELAKKLAPYGYEADKFVKVMWKGVAAMVRNDGAVTNEKRFWDVFTSYMGEQALGDMPVFEEFYQKEFHRAKAGCGENPLAVEAVRAAREKADHVILATNSIFPPVAVEARLSWVNLKLTDFDLVTTYDTDRYCKPNPAYFVDILERMNLAPRDCVMVGNDEKEDMWAAAQAGIAGYLVTDNLIPCPEHPHTGPRGSFAEMVKWLREGKETE